MKYLKSSLGLLFSLNILSACPKESPKKTQTRPSATLKTIEPKRPALFLGGLHQPSIKPTLSPMPSLTPESIIASIPSPSPLDGKKWRFIVKDQVRIREEPSLSAEIIKEASKGEKVELLKGKKKEDSISWHEVRMSEEIGWVSGELLGTKNPNAPIETQPPPPSSPTPEKSASQNVKSSEPTETKESALPTPIPVEEIAPPPPKPVV